MLHQLFDLLFPRGVVSTITNIQRSYLHTLHTDAYRDMYVYMCMVIHFTLSVAVHFHTFVLNFGTLIISLHFRCNSLNGNGGSGGSPIERVRGILPRGRGWGRPASPSEKKHYSPVSFFPELHHRHI